MTTPSSSSSSPVAIDDVLQEDHDEDHQDEQQQHVQKVFHQEDEEGLVVEEVVEVEVLQEESSNNDLLTVTLMSSDASSHPSPTTKITTSLSSGSWSTHEDNDDKYKSVEEEEESAEAEAREQPPAAEGEEDFTTSSNTEDNPAEEAHGKALLDDTTFCDDEEEDDDELEDEDDLEEPQDENHIPAPVVVTVPSRPSPQTQVSVSSSPLPTRPRPTLRVPPQTHPPPPSPKPKPPAAAAAAAAPPPVAAPSCPVFEASLLCGTSYTYTPLCEKMTVMTTAEFEYQQAQQYLLQQQQQQQQRLQQNPPDPNSDYDSNEENEMVSPLPLFFSTRFRTLDAERMAVAVLSSSSSGDSETEVPPPPPSPTANEPPDWYDMFAWLTQSMGSLPTSPSSSSSESSSCDDGGGGGGSTSSPTAGGTSSGKRKKLKLSPWNGHLPLGPEFPTPTYSNSNSSKARRIQRKRLRQQQQQQQQKQKLGGTTTTTTTWDATKQAAAPPPSPTTATCTSTTTANTTSTTSTSSPTRSTSPTHQHQESSTDHVDDDNDNDDNRTTPRPLQILRPLPIIPVNRPGQEDWEMIFLSSDDTSASSTDSKGKHSARRAPTATTSMSIPAGVSPSGSKSDKHSSKHKSSKSGSSSGGGGSGSGSGGMDLDTIAVRTPGADRSALKELPALRDAPPTKREELFILKLKLCSVIFSFDDPTADKRGKDMKRQTLLELVDYVNTPAGQKIFTESVMSDLMAMVSANVCRALPPATDDFDPEEDEPVLEPAWPHLQVAYEFFLRFIVSSEVNAKAAKKYVDQKFCLQLVELFDSEDPRERDYLKTILHRIYGKFMSHRSFIRRAISNVFYRFVYETERHNGIGELLEILGSIINGFAIPLKKEHLQFLVRALIPLHKPKCVALYHQQLSYCIIQYVEKDADTATPILNGFFKCWPWSSSAKQVMFLNELEEILELLGADQLAQVSTMLFTNLARCLDSDHFQVVERALFLWNNEHLVNSGCLSRLNAQTVLPIIYRPLYKNSAGHWNATVEGLAQNVLKMYMEYDLVLYDKCAKAYYREEEEAKRKLEALEAQWTAVEQTAAANMPALMAK